MGCASSSPAAANGTSAEQHAMNAAAAASVTTPTVPSARRPYPRVLQPQQHGAVRNPLLEDSGGTNTDSFLPPQHDVALARPGTVTDPAAVLAAEEQRKAFDAILPNLTESNLDIHQGRLLARRQAEIDAALSASAASHAPTTVSLSFYKAVELLDMWLDAAPASLNPAAHDDQPHLLPMATCNVHTLDNASLYDDADDNNDRTLVSAGAADEDLRLFEPSPPFDCSGRPEL